MRNLPAPNRRLSGGLAPVLVVALSLTTLIGCGQDGPASLSDATVTPSGASAREPAAQLVLPIASQKQAANEGIGFAITQGALWTRLSADSYKASTNQDVFLWSEQRIQGDFEFSADVESARDDYGEAMVVVYGDGRGWTPGCLIFNVTGYWQAIRAHSIYDPDCEWVASNENRLNLARQRYRMTIRISNGVASLLVDDALVASAPIADNINREGYIGLAKYQDSAPVTFSDITFSTGALALAEGNASTPTISPTQTSAPTMSQTPSLTASPRATDTATLAATLTPTPLPTETSIPTQTPLPPYRPPTGMLQDRAPGGRGMLTIDNGTTADALVVLAGLDEKGVKTAYIRPGESYTLTGIQDGEYLIYFSKGEAFDEATNRFTQNATYQRMDITVPFTTTATQYTQWEVTLYAVEGGTVGSKPVDPALFP